MQHRRFDALPAALVLAVVAAFAAAWLTWREWRKEQSAAIDATAFEPAEISFATVRFSDLPGWRDDNQAAAIPALALSCARIERAEADDAANPLEALGPAGAYGSLSGKVGDWLPACAAAKAFAARTWPDAATAGAAARRYFEEYFRPIRITAVRRPRKDGPRPNAPPENSRVGKFTGYYEPTYVAAPNRTDRFSAPVLTRPDDLEIGRAHV